MSKRVRTAEQKAKCAAWFRNYYATKLKHLHTKKSGRKANPEAREARKMAKREERQHLANIRAFFCKKCGNHRAFNPDTGGRCSVCQRRKRMAYRKRAQESGKWGVRARLAKHRRRALRRANGGAGVVTAQDWLDVLAKYGSRCLCCGSDAPPTMDHVVPLAKGGPHDKSNLQPLCHLCNSLKADTVADYRFDRPLAPMARDPNVVRYVPGTD